MKILGTRQVIQTTGLSRTTLWRLERAGHFPPRIRLSMNRVGRLESDIADWIDSRPRATDRSACAGE